MSETEPELKREVPEESGKPNPKYGRSVIFFGGPYGFGFTASALERLSEEERIIRGDSIEATQLTPGIEITPGTDL